MKRRNETRRSSPVRFGSVWTTWTDREAGRAGRIWRLSLNENDGMIVVTRRRAANHRLAYHRRTYRASDASYIRVYRTILNRIVSP